MLDFPNAPNAGDVFAEWIWDGVKWMSAANAGTISGDASGATVLATGSTTARTLATRGAEVFNVRDWGCKQDGSTDDYAALNACVAAAGAAASATGNATIYFPPSAHPLCLSQCINLPSNVTWWAHPGTVTIRPTTTNTTSNPLLFSASGQSNITFYGLTIDGGGQDFANGNDVVVTQQINGITFDHVTIQNTNGRGIQSQYANNFVLRACRFLNIGNHWKTTLVPGDRKEGFNNGLGDYVTWGFGQTIENCYFLNCGYGPVNLGHITGVRITGNTFDSEWQHTYAWSPAPGAGDFPAPIFLHYCFEAEVAGNYIRRSPGNGIESDGSSRVTITGNNIQNCGAGAILVYEEAGYETAHYSIAGNVLMNNNNNPSTNWPGGISLASNTNSSPGVDDVRIVGNVIGDDKTTHTQKWGIYVPPTLPVITNLWIDPSNSFFGNLNAPISSSVPATTYPTLNVTTLTTSTLTATASAAVGSGTKNALTVTPGAASSNAITLTQSGTGGISISPAVTLSAALALQSGAAVSGAALTVAAGETITGGGLTVTAGTVALQSGASISGGAVYIGTNLTAQGLVLNGSATQQKTMDYRTANGIRWRFGTVTNETGTGNAGSDFEIGNYDDGGSTQITGPGVLQLTRATGAVQLGAPGAGIVMGALGATIRSGSGAATGTQPNGSLWIRNDGTTGARLYVSAGGGTWAAVAGV